MRYYLVLLLGVGFYCAFAGKAAGQEKKPNLAQLEKDITAAQSANPAMRTLAIRRLANYPAPVAEKHAEVAALLMKRVKDGKDYDAMRALAIWATPTEAKVIPDFLANDNLTKAAIYALGKLKVAEQAKAIAIYLESGGGRDHEAHEALIEIGPASEDAVLAYLEKKGRPRMAAIEILAKVGGKKSVEPLRKLTEDRDRGVASAAKIAISRIENRLQSNQEK